MSQDTTSPPATPDPAGELPPPPAKRPRGQLGALDRKVLRELRLLWSQALTIALVVACGIGGFLATLSAVDSLARALDDDRLAVDAAQRERDTAASQREVARQERAQAAAALQPPGAAGGKSGAAPLVLRAPADGVVLKVPQPSEASVAAGAVVMTLGDTRQMEILAQLLTTDAVQAQAGGAAVIEGWGGPPLLARVRRVEPAAFTKVSALGVEEQRVNVLLEMTPTPDAWKRMGDGFRVLVRVVTTSADGVLLVPIGALFPRPEGGMAVYRLDGGRARLQPVELGGRNSRVGWVKSGLSAGQRVIVYPPAGVNDDGRVTERSP